MDAIHNFVQTLARMQWSDYLDILLVAYAVYNLMPLIRTPNTMRIARAVLADPRILILDEATASVDTLTEAKIQAALETVTAGRTCLMIAHRLSTVRNADMILVVKNGRIVEQGSHPELLALHGYYYELYTRQYEDEATAKILT